jgi:hypothetical protein
MQTEAKNPILQDWIPIEYCIMNGEYDSQICHVYLYQLVNVDNW